MLFLELVGREVGMGGVIFLHKVGDNLVEGVHTGVLLQRLLVDIVYGGVELALDLLAQLFVVDLVAVLALHVLAQFLGLFHLLEGGVDDKLAVDAGYANLRDSVLEGNVGAGHSG